jgi:hypothetical protein
MYFVPTSLKKTGNKEREREREREREIKISPQIMQKRK